MEQFPEKDKLQTIQCIQHQNYSEFKKLEENFLKKIPMECFNI